MEIKINSLNSATKELTISIPLEEFEEQIDQAYKDVQKNIEIKGFRRGRVPLSLIKKLYGKHIEEDVVSNLATDLFKKVLENEKLDIVGKPSFLEHKILEDKVDFVFNFDIIPDFALSDYKGIKIFEPVHRVTDEEIQKELNALMFSINKTKEINKVTNYDLLVKCQSQRLDSQTEQTLNGSELQTISINLSTPYLTQSTKDLFLDKGVGDEIIVNANELDNSVSEGKILLKITEILEPDFEQLDEEYIKHLTNGRLSSIEDYKEDIGFQLQSHWDNESRKEMEHQIIDYLVDYNDFELPNSVLEETAIKIAKDFAQEYLKGKKLSDEDFSELVKNARPLAVRQVKWAIIKKKIAEVEHIEVEDFDIEDFAHNLQQRYNLDFEEAKKIISQEKQFKDVIIDKKVIDFLVSFAETEEIEFTEYRKKMEHHHHHNYETDYSEGNEIPTIVSEQSSDTPYNLANDVDNNAESIAENK